jgi:hypothetical protein
MIFFKAFLTSFAILWRFALVLPILVILLAVFGVVAVIVAFLMGLFSSALSVAFGMAFGIASGIVAVMVGLRVGLQSYHIKPRNTYAGLIMPALGYGLIEARLVLMMIAVTLMVFILLTPLDVVALLAMNGPTDTAILTEALDANSGLWMVCVLVGCALVAALRSALMIPLAGAAIGKDPDGRSHTPFYGFGDGFASLYPLVLVSQIGLVLCVPFTIWVAGPLGITDSMAQTTIALEEAAMDEAIAVAAAAQAVLDAAAAEAADPNVAPEDLPPVEQVPVVPEPVTTEQIVTANAVDLGIVGAIMFAGFLYFFSLQCAGAVLVYVRDSEGAADAFRRHDEALKAQLKADEEPPMEQTDIMELMRSRMQNRHHD